MSSFHLPKDPLQSFSLPELVQDITSQLRKNGYASIPNFYRPETAEAIYSFAQSKVQEKGNGIFSLKEDELRNTLLYSLMKHPFLNDLIYEVCKGSGIETKRARYYCRMGVKLADGHSRDENRFHFDGARMTFACPVMLPEKEEEGGALLLLPSARPHWEGKIFDRVSRKLFESSKVQALAGRRAGGVKSVRYTPGGLTVFQGYSTWHATGPMAASARRVVAFFHPGNARDEGPAAY